MDRAEEFNVDDVVEVHSLRVSIKANGARGTIMEPLQFVRSRCEITHELQMDYRYLVHIEGDGAHWYKPENLRKPPEEFDAATLQEAADLIARLTRVHAFEKVGKA